MNNQKPNILVVLCDQMRYDCMGNAGNRYIHTPHFDRLAAEGVSCTEAHVGSPLCAPFRASMLTGKHATNNGVLVNFLPLNFDQLFLAEFLKTRGYSTGYSGKWHLNGGKGTRYVEPHERLGFEHFIGLYGGHQYANAIFYRNNDPTPRRCERYEPDFQTDHIIEFMENTLNAEDKKPFFAVVSYGLPHNPNVAPPWWLDLYRPDAVELPEDVDPDMEEIARKFLAEYYGLVSCVDFQLGRLLTWLDHAGITKDTIVIAVSDHGDSAGQHLILPMRKDCPYRYASQVPFIVRWPEHLPCGKKLNNLIDPAIDIFPTLCGLLGIENMNGNFDGVDISKQLMNPDHEVDRVLFHQSARSVHPDEEIYYRNQVRAIRTNEWVYAEKMGKPYQLFNELSDPNESINLVDNEHYMDVQERCAKILHAKMQQIGDSWQLEIEYGGMTVEKWERAQELSKYNTQNSVLEITRDAALGRPPKKQKPSSTWNDTCMYSLPGRLGFPFWKKDYEEKIQKFRDYERSMRG